MAGYSGNQGFQPEIRMGNQEWGAHGQSLGFSEMSMPYNQGMRYGGQVGEQGMIGNPLNGQIVNPLTGGG